MNDELISKGTDDPTLTKAQRKKLKRLAKKAEDRKVSTKKGIKKWVGIVLIVLVIIAVVGAFVRWSVTRKSFPPTSSVNHTEVLPEKHISNVPFSFSVQKHMLEHADGKGPPGVFINYNCNDFECEDDLIDKLTTIAQDYPEFVYLAPYRNMGAKLVLTKEGQQEVFESFDEDKIRSFIR